MTTEPLDVELILFILRLMSGALGSIIASDVTSYHLLSAPLPGVLYGVEEGEQQGLWFAAL